MNQTALYYPYIHFRQEGWLKTSALYWNRIARIVPSGYPLHDSDTVRVLRDELGLIDNVDPVEHAYRVQADFFSTLNQLDDSQLERYAIRNADRWPQDPATVNTHAGGGRPQLAYVHVTKIAPSLQEALIERGLAQRGAPPLRGEWLGMHPSLAHAYMAALAGVISGRIGYSPLTDDPSFHLAAADMTMERRLGQVLGFSYDAHNVGPAELEALAVSMAFETVVPASIDNIPIDTIVRLRRRYEGELHAFQDAVADIVGEAEELFASIEDVEARAKHMRIVYDRHLGQPLKELRRAFESERIGTVIAGSGLVVSAMIPLVDFTTAGAVAGVLGTANFVIKLSEIWLAKKRARRGPWPKDPAAYLFELERGLDTRQALAHVP